MSLPILNRAIDEKDTENFARIVEENAGSLDTPLHPATKYGHDESVAEILRHQSENTSSRQNLRDVLEAAGAKRRRCEASGSTENVNDPNTELLEEPSHQYIAINLELGTPSEPRPESGTRTSLTDELTRRSRKNINVARVGVANRDQTIPRFGGLSDQGNSSRRNEVSRIRMRQKRHKRREIYREELYNARETITLVAILIATVTYTGGTNPPGGVYQDGPLRGTAAAARTTAFKVFAVCNNVALFASLGVVIALVSVIPLRRKPQIMMVKLAYRVMLVAAGFMAAAYSAASVVLIPPPHGQVMDWTVISLVSISAGTLGSVFVALGFVLTSHRLKKWRYS